MVKVESVIQTDTAAGSINSNWATKPCYIFVLMPTVYLIIYLLVACWILEPCRWLQINYLLLKGYRSGLDLWWWRYDKSILLNWHQQKSKIKFSFTLQILALIQDGDIDYSRWVNMIVPLVLPSWQNQWVLISSFIQEITIVCWADILAFQLWQLFFFCIWWRGFAQNASPNLSQ